MELDNEEVAAIFSRFEIDPTRPMILQVSRFDYFKDPLGVIEAYRLAKKFKHGLQLVLAGGGAPDDPEGDKVLNEVQNAAKNDPDIHVLFRLPMPIEPSTRYKEAPLLFCRNLSRRDLDSPSQSPYGKINR